MIFNVTNASHISSVGSNDMLSIDHKFMRDTTMLQESATSDNSEEVFRLRKEHKKKK